MNNNKVNKNKVLKKIFCVLMAVLGCVGVVCLLVPIFTYLLETYFQIFSVLVIGSSMLGIGLLISLIPECIKIEKVNDYDSEIDLEIDSEVMRERLCVVNGKENSLNNNNFKNNAAADINTKYRFKVPFDNNYRDPVWEDDGGYAIDEDELYPESEEYLRAIGAFPAIFVRKRKKNH